MNLEIVVMKILEIQDKKVQEILETNLKIIEKIVNFTKLKRSQDLWLLFF